jgi:hypothetical protein
MMKVQLCKKHDLFLKVKFGVPDFLSRHRQITDGTQDGGLDAYHIDTERKKLYLIQAKFRNTTKNFDEKAVEADDLVKMEVARITKGHETDSSGVRLNDKVLSFQKELQYCSPFGTHPNGTNLR